MLKTTMMNTLLDPMFHISLLWIYGFIFLVIKHKISKFMYLSFVYFFICISPIPFHLYKLVVFNQEADHKKVDAVVVLSGGTVHVSKLNNQPYFFGESERFYIGVHEFLQTSSDYLVFTGHDFKEGFFTEAQSMLLVAKHFGINENKIIIEDQSRSTNEHVQYLKPIFVSKNIKSISIVTSSSHLPRAKLIFESIGLEVNPIPSDQIYFEYYFFHNYSGYLKKFYYETLALTYYKIRFLSKTLNK